MLLDKFSEFCHDGSHAMLAYIDNQGGISVLVDIFGVAVYDIKVCKHIPTFCENNCILQRLTLMVQEIESVNVYVFMTIMILFQT